MEKPYTLLPPTYLSDWNLEYSIHSCPKLLFEDFRAIFPTQTFTREELRIVVTFQASSEDLLSPAPETGEAKDQMLETFMQWAEHIRQRVSHRWTDYLDPASGLPVSQLLFLT